MAATERTLAAQFIRRSSPEEYKKPMFRRLFLILVAALLLGSGPAFAQGRPAPAPHAQTLDRILPQIRNRYPGTLYDAEGPYPDENGMPHYRLKWMTPEGRVIWLDADGRNGRVIGAPRAGAYPAPAYGASPYGPPPGYPAPRRGYNGYGYPQGGYYGAPRGGYYAAPRGGYYGAPGAAPRGGYYGGRPSGGWGGGAPRGGYSGGGPRGNGPHGGH